MVMLVYWRVQHETRQSCFSCFGEKYGAKSFWWGVYPSVFLVEMRTASIVRLVCVQNGEQQSRLHHHYKYAEYASQKHIRSVLPFMLNHPEYFYIRKKKRHQVNQIPACRMSGGFVMVTPGFAQQLEGITYHEIICWFVLNMRPLSL